MSNSCAITPKAPNGKSSKLFTDLYAKTKDREMTKTIWAFTKTNLFKSEFDDMPKDENGEITYDSIADILQLDNILSQSQKDEGRAIDNGILAKNGIRKKFSSPMQALEKSDEYNKTAKSKVAVVEETDDGQYTISVKDKTLSSVTEASRQADLTKLNNFLIELLRKAGFDVSFADNPAYNGIFNPLLADLNASTLKTVIEIANGERGAEALPEEVAHLILAGLKNHDLKLRLDKQLNRAFRDVFPFR